MWWSMIVNYHRVKMLIDRRDFLSNREQCISCSYKCAVIPNRHLLHLPLYSLRIYSKKFRFLTITRNNNIIPLPSLKNFDWNQFFFFFYLVEAIESEGKELRDVRLLREGGEREETRHRGWSGVVSFFSFHYRFRVFGSCFRDSDLKVSELFRLWSFSGDAIAIAFASRFPSLVGSWSGCVFWEIWPSREVLSGSDRPLKILWNLVQI